MNEPRATLYGLQCENVVTVVTFLIPINDEDYESILPAGLEQVGYFALGLDDLSSDTTVAIINSGGKLDCYVQENERFREADLKITSVAFATLRLRTKIPLQLSCKSEETDAYLDKLLDKINSDAAAFLLDRSRVVVTCNGCKSALIGAPQDIDVQELSSYVGSAEEEGRNSNNVWDRQLPLDFKLFWSSVSDDESVAVPHCAPLIYHQKSWSLKTCSPICSQLIWFCNSRYIYLFVPSGVNPTVCLALSLDTLSVIPWSEPAENIGPILSTAITRQIKLFVEDLKEQLNVVPVDQVKLPQILHFRPDSLQHFVTLAYHPDRSDDQLGKLDLDSWNVKIEL